MTLYVCMYLLAYFHMCNIGFLLCSKRFTSSQEGYKYFFNFAISFILPLQMSHSASARNICAIFCCISKLYSCSCSCCSSGCANFVVANCVCVLHVIYFNGRITDWFVVALALVSAVRNTPLDVLAGFAQLLIVFAVS